MNSNHYNQMLSLDIRVAPGSETVYCLMQPESPGKIRPAVEYDCLFRVGKTRCTPDYYCHFYPAYHTCFMYFISGSGTLYHDKMEYHPVTGDLFILHAGSEWEYMTDPKDPWELIWLNSQTSVGGALLEMYELEDKVCVHNADVYPVMNTIFDIMSHVDKRPWELRDNVMNRFLHLIQQTAQAAQFRHGDTKQLRDANIMKEYIDAHIMENIRLSDVSRLVYRSDGGATTIFRKAYGLSVKEYILQTKLEIASRLLIETPYTVTAISDMLTFCDAQHFSRIFRSRYNMAPLAYRKNMREIDSRNSGVSHEVRLPER